jgi:2,3-bisphosphoglycerate-independent phosphoglycerate mutase
MSELAPLVPHSRFAAIEGPVVVIVMDGIGLGREDEGDAVHRARKPTLDWLRAHVPTTSLRAHGVAVGLPSDEDMGNSEVGHNALGAGRIFDQGAKLVNQAIATGALFRGEAWRKAIAQVLQSGEPLHLLGLLSDGNVHSHEEHLYALIARAEFEGVKHLRVHALLDGRDVPETSALIYVAKLEAILEAARARGLDYCVASGGGRMKVTMDRYEADWAMVARGWSLHVKGEGRTFASMTEAIETFRSETPGISDQNLPGFVIAKGGAAVGPIRDGAAVLLFNFRGDRALEISRAFEEEHFTKFERGPKPDVFFAGMMQYDGDLHVPKHFLVSPPEIDGTLAERLSLVGLSQFACSETQKFGHVTYFWNGNRSQPFAHETWREVHSDTLPFEERPWMKAAEVTDALITALQTGAYKHARINFANGDMVGHTGKLEATTVAVECVDLQLARLLPVIASLKGALLITADHGNADDMIERNKKTGALEQNQDGTFRPKTSHSLNAVPCFLYAPSAPSLRFREDATAGLANIAATVIELLGYTPPETYCASLLG